MSLDLLPLVPEKFRDSAILQALFQAIAEEIDTWHQDIDDLTKLLDPHNVPDVYLQHLASLVGAILTSEDEVTPSERRKELVRMVDWYKIKGTYKSLRVIGLMAGLSIVVYDMYTDDYATFVDVVWFVGNEGENPAGLDSTYYKSPHFGVSTLLDKIYPSGTYSEGFLDRHLWRPSLFSGVVEYVEKTRPVNTVPHFRIYLHCITDESMTVYTITTPEISTQIVGYWEYSKWFFDGGALGSDEQKYFDDGESFDPSVGAFYNSIDTWKLGTDGKDLRDSGVAHEVGGIVLQGSIDSVTIYGGRIEYEFTIPKATIQYGINELGLYRSAFDDLIIMSTFPDINKGSNTELKVVVVVNRTL